MAELGRRAWLGLWLLLTSCTSAMFDAEKSPFTQAEVNRALAPLKQLEQRCYADSASKRARRTAKLEFIAYVNGKGHVHADPVAAEPQDPELVVCLRTGISGLSFPAKNEADQLHLAFELRP